MRLERMEFWFPLSSPEDIALSRAVRAIFEARGGGLLGDSVAALIQNFDTAGPMRSETWYCKLQTRVRRVSPNFSVRRISAPSSISITGFPVDYSDLPPKEIARCFVVDASLRRCKQRFDALLRMAPSISQQDFILHAIVLMFPRVALKSTSAIFIKLPNFAQFHVRDVVKFLSGTGGFARVHAHYDLRYNKGIALPETCKRACLLCMLASTTPRSEVHHPLDSEWHFLFECPTTLPARTIYRTKVLDQFSAHMLPWDPSLESLVTHVMRAREFPDLLHLFAICVSSSFSLRHKAVSQVSVHSIRSAFSADADA